MGALTKTYLVAYNATCLGLWGAALAAAVGAMLALEKEEVGQRLVAVWPASGLLVAIGQVAMILEVLHAMFGLVRSPVFTTALQVSSRLWILAVAYWGEPACSVASSQPTGLMVLSWASVEVIRYSFYLAALLLPKVPFPIFWLRYSAFYVLYPTGITGELGTAITALSRCSGTFLEEYFWLFKLIMVFYIPGSPFMYMNMVSNRKSAFKKRFAPPPKPPRGCQFPVTDAKKGTRSTTVSNKNCLAAALEACGEAGERAALKCRKEKNYRFAYVKHYLKLVDLCASSQEHCVKASEAGIKWFRDNFEYVDADGTSRPFGDAVVGGLAKSARTLTTGVVKGESTSGSPREYVVPYDGGWHPTTPAPPKETISKDALTKRLDAWVEGGIVEADAAAAVKWTANYVSAGGSLSQSYFVLIGAGSAMGPCAKLLEHGANVVAIDIPGKWGKGGKRPASGLWKRLFKLAQDSPGGSLTYPKSKDEDLTEEECAGCDLMNECKEIGDWLCETWLPTVPAKSRVCIGNYTYLDGDLHVKLSVCADALIERLLNAASKSSRQLLTSCAFLCTPTDAHIVPQKAFYGARDALESREYRGLENILYKLTGYLKPNLQSPVLVDPDAKLPEKAHRYVVDGLSVAQGPNYALAKRTQHWRAVLAFYQGKHTVSSVVAPSTATLSVIHNKTFAWAYGGMPNFGFEIFKQETTNAIMTAVLLHDVLNEDSVKNPTSDDGKKVENGLQIFSSEAVHGGLWRSPYAVDTIGEVSALIYFSNLATPYFMAAGLASAVVAIAALLVTY